MSWLFEGVEHELLALTDPEFIGIWAALFGGPPAAMIARPDMIAMMRDDGPLHLGAAIERFQAMASGLRPGLRLKAAPEPRR